MKMKFAMTGHKGLIGTSLLQRLKDEGNEPVLLVDKREGKDILDIGQMQPAASLDIMLHLASYCKINRAIENPKLAFDNNVRGTYEVMEFCRKQEISKIVFTSSSRVLHPEKNIYTASKLWGEELVRGYQLYGIEHVIIRPSTVYGPFDDHTSRLIDIFIRAAMKNEELKIFGNESKTLDFTFVDDFVSGFLLAMSQRNDDYNIASGQSTKVVDVAEMIIKMIGGGRKVFYDAEIAQPQEVQVDISKIARLGYKPRVGIEEGVRRCVDWYKDHIKV